MQVQLCVASVLLVSCSDSTQTSIQRDTEAIRKHEQRKIQLQKMELGPDECSLQQASSKYMPNVQKPNWSDYRDAAEKALKKKDYDAAVQLLDEAIRLSPERGGLYNMRGRARANSMRSNDGAALEDLNKARSLNALTDGGYNFIARLLDSRSKTNEAIQALGEGIKKYPESRELFQARAVIYAAHNQMEKAKADYDKSIELDGDQSELYLLRGQLLQRMNRFADAIKDFDECTKHSKNDKVDMRSVALKAKAGLLAKMGKHQEAIDTISRIETQESDEDLLQFRGDQYAALKNYPRALSEYSEAIEASPEFARGAYEGRANVYETLGRLEMAALDRAKARKLQDAPAEKTIYKIK